MNKLYSKVVYTKHRLNEMNEIIDEMYRAFKDKQDKITTPINFNNQINKSNTSGLIKKIESRMYYLYSLAETEDNRIRIDELSKLLDWLYEKLESR